MLSFSLFKFSRYFFVMFLVVTVLPLLSLLLWSNYVLTQNINSHERHMIEVISRDTLAAYQTNLFSEIKELSRINANTQEKVLPLKDAKALFDADNIWEVNSKEATTFAKQQPEVAFLRQKAAHQVFGTYFFHKNKIGSLFIIPPTHGRPGFILTKSVPTAALFPQGPVWVEVFAGNSTQRAHRIATSPFRERFDEPKEHHFRGPHGRRVHILIFNPGEPQHLLRGVPPEHFGPPDFGPPMGPPPDEPMFFDEKHEHQPPLQTLEKTAQVTNIVGTPVITLKLHLRRPPEQPGILGQKINHWIGALILLGGALFSLLAGNYMQKNFIAPLMRLSLAARKIQEGNLSIRIDTHSVRQPEVRQTLENVNQMLDGLAEKEQLRNSFISNLTHDFRTPLIAQSRSLELLSTEFRQLGLAEQEKLANGIVKNNEHLLTMVNQLLETYQTEAGMFTLSFRPESIPKLVNHCFDQLSSLAESHNITLSQQFPDDFPDIMADAYYLKRVLINLLGNAIQNIPKHSKVQVVGKRLSPDTVEIRVKDNGLGIQPEEQQHLFDRYYAGTGDTRKLGSGLGLYICKVLIAAHQGTISVESVSGDYTDFVIHLPVSRPEDSHDPQH
jgi:signal transduction histidine kinase